MSIEAIGDEGSAPARLACLNLIHAYNNLADTGQHLKIPDLFSDDAVLNSSDEMTGIEAIRAGMKVRAAARRKTLHVTSNVQFLEAGPERLTALSTLSVHVFADKPEALTPNVMARISDEFTRLASGEWRFKRRDFDVFARLA